MADHNATIALELSRIRWQAEAALSGAENVSGDDAICYVKAKIGGIIEALDRIDAAKGLTAQGHPVTDGNNVVAIFDHIVGRVVRD